MHIRKMSIGVKNVCKILLQQGYKRVCVINKDGEKKAKENKTMPNKNKEL